MDNDTFEEDVDFLFQDHERRSPRARCSDTNFSSNFPDGARSYESAFFEENFEERCGHD